MTAKTHHIAIFAACFVASVSAHAQNAVSQPDATEEFFDSEKPISVNADSFTADLSGGTGTYSGNVVVKQGAMRMRADRVVVTAPGDKATQLQAQGRVVVDSPSGTAMGDRGQYNVAAQIVYLEGNVVLTRGDNVMRGTAFELQVPTGKARLTGAPRTNSQTGNERVQGLFIPNGEGQESQSEP